MRKNSYGHEQRRKLWGGYISTCVCYEPRIFKILKQTRQNYICRYIKESTSVLEMVRVNFSIIIQPCTLISLFSLAQGRNNVFPSKCSTLKMRIIAMKALPLFQQDYKASISMVSISIYLLKSN